MNPLAFGALALLLGIPVAGRAAEPTPPPAVAAAPAKGDTEIEQVIHADASACRALCVDDNGISLFGGVITVPFERPSVEQCGIWMSSTAAERAADTSSRRREADAEAIRQRYSPREKEELRKRATEPMKKCESDFRRRCGEVREKVPAAERQKAVAAAQKGVAGILDARKKKAAELYLKNVLAECPFSE